MPATGESSSSGASRNRACRPSASRTHGTNPKGTTISNGTHGLSGEMNIQIASSNNGTHRCSQREYVTAWSGARSSRYMASSWQFPGAGRLPHVGETAPPHGGGGGRGTAVSLEP